MNVRYIAAQAILGHAVAGLAISYIMHRGFSAEWTIAVILALGVGRYVKENEK